MKKVLLTSAVALAAFGAVQAVSAATYEKTSPEEVARLQRQVLAGDTNVKLDKIVKSETPSGNTLVREFVDGHTETLTGSVNPTTGLWEYKDASGKVVATYPAGQTAKDVTNRDYLNRKGYIIKPDRTAANGFNRHVRVTVVDGGGRPVPNVFVDFQIIRVNGDRQQNEVFTAKTNAYGDADLSDFTAYDGNGKVVAEHQSVLFNAGEVLKYRVATTATDFKEATDIQGELTVSGDMYTNASITVPYKNDDRSPKIGNQTSQASYGWAKTAEGWKFFEKATAVKGWKQVEGKWYYFNAQGVMQKWWVKDGNTWYYLNGTGAMETGWLQDGGKWYYLENSGAMKASQWFEVAGKWYYVDGSGALAVNTTVGGYTVDANGAWVK